MDGLNGSVERLRRADEVFGAALDLPASERAAYIDATCADDVELHSAVHRLLRAHDQSTDFLASPAGAATPLMEGVLAKTAGLPAPQRLGPFRVLSRIGHGGMGAVYLGERDDGQFSQRVALKVVNLGLGTEHLVRHFLRERRILAGLEHPHIARLLDGGLTIDGAPWFAMELVEGQPIDRYCADRKLSVDERIRLFHDVCEAVDYAHEMRVIHRDLKPTNILVSRSGAVKLLDFGIAKLLDPDDAGSNAVTTRPTFAPVTPEYAAPEQLRGQPASAANDVYALGVVLYELLVGERPYRARGRAVNEAERILYLTDPPRPSVAVRRLHGQWRPLRGDLDTIVTRMLQTDPQRRYASVAAVVEDLRRHADGRPLLARPDTLLYRARRFARRRQSAGIAIASLVLFATGAMGLYASRSDDDAAGSRQQRDALELREPLIVADFRVIGPDSVLGPALGDVFGRYLGQSRMISIMPARRISDALQRMRQPSESRLNVALAREVAQREGLRAVVAGDLVPLGAGYLMTVRLLAAATGDELAGAQATATRPEDVLAALDSLGRSFRSTIGESLRDVSNTPRLDLMTTSSLDALRKYSEARWGGVDFRRQLVLYREAIALDSTFAYAYVSLGALMGSVFLDFPARDSALTRAYQLRDRLSDMERSTITAFYWKDVRHDRRQAMAAYETQIAGDSTDWRAILNLAAYLNETREFARAESLLRRHEKIVGGRALRDLVKSLIGQGRLAVADSTLAAALERRPNDLVALVTGLAAASAGMKVDSAAAFAARLNAITPRPVQLRPVESLIQAARMRGRLAEARRLRVEAGPMYSAPGTTPNGFPDSLDAVREDLWLRGALGAAAARLETIIAARPVELLLTIDDKSNFLHATALYAAAGQPGRARALLRAVVRASDSLTLKATFPQRQLVLAEIALAEGRADEAAARFRRSDIAGDGLPVSACTVCALPGLARSAELAGLPDSARSLWERYATTTSIDRASTDSWFLAMAYRRLAALHAAAGNRAIAATYDEKVAMLWRDADGELRQPVVAARKRLAQLR